MGKVIEKMVGQENPNTKFSPCAVAPVFMNFTFSISLHRWITVGGPVFFFDQKILKGARKP